MHTRAKFNIQSITLMPGQGQGGIVKMQAVSRGSRNASWSQYTPSGTIEMSITNPTALEQFVTMLNQNRETGKYPEIYVDFTAAEDGWVGDGHTFEPPPTDEIPEGSAYANQCAQCGYLVNVEYAGKPSHPNG